MPFLGQEILRINQKRTNEVKLRGVITDFFMMRPPFRSNYYYGPHVRVLKFGRDRELLGGLPCGYASEAFGRR